MSERIQALVEQATSRPHRDQGIGGEPTHIYPGTFSVEKFAELIVRECIEQLRLVPYGSDSIEFGEEVPYQDAIKKHFGVEE